MYQEKCEEINFKDKETKCKCVFNEWKGIKLTLIGKHTRLRDTVSCL